MKYLLLITSLWLSNLPAAELVFDPPNPVIPVGQQLTLSVSGTNGEIIWSAGKGQILGSGTSVTYMAPGQAGSDVITVLDSAENVGVVKVTVSNQIISRENAQWEVFINRSRVRALALSADGETLWLGTGGGLEQRETQTGELQKIFINTDGLPSNDIYSLLNEDQNRLWVGTREGLAYRNELGEWTVYTKENSGLPSNWAYSLLSDGQGGLWIGTPDKGLAHLTGAGEWRVDNQENSGLPSNKVTFLFEQDGLWIGTEDGGLAHRTGLGEWTVYNTENSQLPHNQVKSLSSDGQGGLWIGTWGGGLTHRSGSGEWNVYHTENLGLLANYVFSLYRDGQGELWIGTVGGLVHLTRTGEWFIYHTENSGLPTNSIVSLLGDGEGGVWIGTDDHGLAHRRKSGEWLVYTSANTLFPAKLSNWINILLSDKQGGLWIGTWNGGLAHRSELGEWLVYRTDTEDSLLPHDNIKSLLHDGQGGLWIGTDGGGLAHRTRSNEWTVYTKENSGLPGNRVNSLLHDGQGGLWIGTWDGGLAHRTGAGEWTAYHPENSKLPVNQINSLLNDGQGGLWIGTWGLVHLTVSGEWIVYSPENSGLPTNEVTTLLSDEQGGLWVGTVEGGLAHWSKTGEWTVYHQDNSELPANWVTSLLSDGQGGLWVGTWGGLVHRSKSGVWNIYRADNSGLPGNDVHSLLSDEQGGLWIGSWGLAHLNFGRKNELCSEAKMSAQTCQDLFQNQRAAILIAAGGAQPRNSLWDTTEIITSHFYKTLYRRGFDHSEIYYLSSEAWADFNGDGINDHIVDAPTTKRPLTLTDIKQALEWAKQQGQLLQPLYLFIMTHGSEGKLLLDEANELQANDFKSLLDDYQTVTGNQVIVIIEASHSGSFLSALSAPNRAIISSASSEEFTYFIAKRGFSYFLADNLLTGMNFRAAFDLASQTQTQLRGYNPSLTETIYSLTQTPQLDDNHDGLYTSADGEWLKTIYINGDFETAGPILAIENLTTSTIIQAGQPLTLKAKATTASGHIKSMWAILKPPKIDVLRDIHGTPIDAYPRLNLSKTGQENVWQTQWQEALYNGDYRITFWAEDDDGKSEYSDESIIITVTNGINSPPTANVQLQLGKTRYQRGEQFTAKLIENLNWGYDLYAAVVMPDGQFLTFKRVNEPSSYNQPNHWLAQRPQNEQLTVIDLNLPESLAVGEYCLYGILSPQKQPPLEIQAAWKWKQQCFEVF